MLLRGFNYAEAPLLLEVEIFRAGPPAASLRALASVAVSCHLGVFREWDFAILPEVSPALGDPCLQASCGDPLSVG